MSDIVISPEAKKVIAEYLYGSAPFPVAYGTEAYSFEDFRLWVIDQYKKPPLVFLKDEERNKYSRIEVEKAQKKYKAYFARDIEILSASPNANKLQHYPYVNYRKLSNKTLQFHARCERYIRDHIGELATIFCNVNYGSVKKAIDGTEHLYELWNGFEDWFEKWRKRVKENMKNEIEKKKEIAVKTQTGAKLRTGSVGGVANLLKVLTKTMEQQGADIRSIAKMQYNVCLQNGVILPDEFITDVATALTIEEKLG